MRFDPVEILGFTRVGTLLAVWIVSALGFVSVIVIRRLQRSPIGGRLFFRVISTLLGLMAVTSGLLLLGWIVGRR